MSFREKVINQEVFSQRTLRLDLIVVWLQRIRFSGISREPNQTSFQSNPLVIKTRAGQYIDIKLEKIMERKHIILILLVVAMVAAGDLAAAAVYGADAGGVVGKNSCDRRSCDQKNPCNDACRCLAFGPGPGNCV